MPSSSPTEISAFFSYAHHDQKTDSQLVEALTTELENRVNAKLVNARFHIWRDTENIRTGDAWSEKIEQTINRCHIFIALLTPSWIDSPWCRRELSIFEETEASRGFEFVAPLLARDIAKQMHHFSPDQKAIWHRLERRQYATVGALEFLQLGAAERSAVIDKVADDLEGMVERARMTAGDKPDAGRLRHVRQTKEFRGTPHNYADVDLVSSADVILRKSEGARSDVLAQIDFIERLYVQGINGRIDFGVRRAYFSVETDGSGRLFRTNSFWKTVSPHAYYVTMQGASTSTIAICIDPQDQRRALSDLSLPAAEGENRFAIVAAADRSLNSDNLYAELTISLIPTDLQLSGERTGSISSASRAKIEAIMTVAASKETSSVAQGRVKRRIDVSEDSN